MGIAISLLSLFQSLQLWYNQAISILIQGDEKPSNGWRAQLILAASD